MSVRVPRWSIWWSSQWVRGGFGHGEAVDDGPVQALVVHGGDFDVEPPVQSPIGDRDDGDAVVGKQALLESR